MNSGSVKVPEQARGTLSEHQTIQLDEVGQYASLMRLDTDESRGLKNSNNTF